MPKTIVLDADDYAASNIPFDELIPLKEHFPNLKITLFTIPYDRNLANRLTIDKLQEWAELTKKFDWIEIAMHGFAHEWNEFNVPYQKAVDMLIAGEKLFKEFSFMQPRKNVFFGPEWLKKKRRTISLNIPSVKIFKAPRWQYSKESFEALRDRGYAVGTDRNQPRPDIPGMIQYRYNWSFEEPFPQDLEVIKGHGHVNAGMANDLSNSYANLLKMPTDARFLFVSEYLQKYGSD